ncbi:MAG: tRNA (adenosine(37)-N6)-threonylcarbamoyltransferase complex ATPase subunit type 1 TsaE [Elusimicrobia bacterium CG06_land_8_20_14_3_00_38_11]|nr:MAG: tRNA (adenosine(37)-N6)-threonylcarbamoyltransferase complex ATPase subunit type 1 TsaE [Elusimicrobia bacterium CG06_land_8_20_14_3_00_38_11]
MFQSKTLSGDLVSKSPLGTFNFGRKIAEIVKCGSVICLYGTLGAGKTVIVQGICKGLKVKGFVNSPSFKIVNEYRGKFPVYHIDLYRLNSASEINDLGLDEYIYGDGITIIEWAGKLGKKNLPKKRIEIYIKIKNENEREIKWQRYQ